jgi:hypothetical protein
VDELSAEEVAKRDDAAKPGKGSPRWAGVVRYLRAVGSLPTLLFGVVALVVLVQIVRSFLSGAQPVRSAQGAIYVDSPEVYTRERLVNDRYEQDEWLREQLKETTNVPAALAGSFASKDQRSRDMRVAAGQEASGGLDAGTLDGAQPEPSTVSDIDRFLDLTSYRDVIRAELIENQLDDRHDLDGNTVYRLKFDCSIVPVARTSASAVVEVRVLKVVDPSAFERGIDAGSPAVSASNDPKERSGVARELRSLAGRELYESWLRETVTETQATLDKRLGDMYVLLKKVVDARRAKQAGTTAKSAVPEPPPEPSDQLRQDLEALREELQSQDTKGVCNAWGEDLLDHATCLMLHSPAGGLVGDREQKARLRSGFVDHFAKQMTQYFDGLLQFNVERETDGLRARVLDLLDGKRVKDRSELDKIHEHGFTRFQELINPESSENYAYAVAPKERADSLGRAGVLGDRTSYGLAAAAPLGSADARASVNSQREREVNASLIERHPRVVGFSNNISWGATFGWVIGPRFAMPEHAAAEPRFEQHASHHSLSAIVSAPSWWTRVEMQILVYWFDAESGQCTHEDGTPFKPCPPKVGWAEVGKRVQKLNVRLPGDTRILGERIARLLRKIGRATDDVKAPAIAKEAMVMTPVEVGREAEIIIPGQYLWRSPVVTLGSQRAKRIEILPNMNGIVAYFDPIVEPAGWDGKAAYDKAPLTVWTSQKQPDSVVGRVLIYPRKKAVPSVNVGGAPSKEAPPVVEPAAQFARR